MEAWYYGLETHQKVIVLIYIIPYVLSFVLGAIYNLGHYRRKRDIEFFPFGIAFFPLLNMLGLTVIFDTEFKEGLQILGEYMQDDYVIAFAPVLALGLIGFLI